MRMCAKQISVAALMACAGMAFATGHTGVSSSASPYLVEVAGGPAVDVFSILSVGDSVTNTDGSTYRMVGIPDGLGAYNNGDGTMTVLMNHELVTTQGIARAHQAGTGQSGGSFVSQWTINTGAGSNFLRATSGRDLDTSVVTTSNGTGGASATFSRFCSADLADQSAYYNAATGLGTTEKIYLNGEENGVGGRMMAHVVSARTGYQLNAFDTAAANGGGSWENAVARPLASDTTVVMANSDGGSNRVYAYVGTKSNSGSVLDRAGLTGGTNYGIQVSVNGVNVASESRDFGFATSGSAVLNGRFSLTSATAGTTFLRPEDGAWDQSHPNDYYFVTTDRLDQVRDGVGTQVGRSRLWRMSYDSAGNPSAGGTIEALLDGTEGHNMLDNICVVPGTDGHTRLIMLEDVGNAAHNGKVWLYDATTDQLTMILSHDPARFGDIGRSATSPFTVDEESSGVIDARDTLGLGWFLIDVQAHYTIAGELAEGGQLLAFYCPDAIPTPGALSLLGVAALGAARRRR